MSAAHADGIALRKARLSDAPAIARLVNGFAAERTMLPRTEDEVALAIDDYVVAADGCGRVIACGALKEYSPSVAEVASIAVAGSAQRRGLGRRIVARVEALAHMRGYGDVFLFTVSPNFFESIGYVVINGAGYPEKEYAGDACQSTRDSERLCMWRSLGAAADARAMEHAA